MNIFQNDIWLIYRHVLTIIEIVIYILHVKDHSKDIEDFVSSYFVKCSTGMDFTKALLAKFINFIHSSSTNISS